MCLFGTCGCVHVRVRVFVLGIHVFVYLDHVGVRVRMRVFALGDHVCVYLDDVGVRMCAFVFDEHVCVYLDHACACVYFFWVPHQ